MSRLWARGRGLSLLRADPAAELSAGIRRALADGIERGYEGELPALPPDVERYIVRAAGSEVGLLALRRGHPCAGAATVYAVAIDPARRGHCYATDALLLAERRLAREGVTVLYARVPRGNGRGFYFMLRAGYVPVPPPAGTDPDGNAIDGVTWFRATPLSGRPSAAGGQRSSSGADSRSRRASA